MQLLHASLLALCFAGQASAHGVLSKPLIRGCQHVTNNPWCNEYGNFGPKAIVGNSAGTATTGPSNYVCNGQPKGNSVVTFNAGATVDFTFWMVAPHPGDCALYVSYDDDAVADNDKNWALIWTKKDCLCYAGNPRPNGATCSYFPEPNSGTCPQGCSEFRNVPVELPSWLPAGNNVVFHWEWYATHPRESGSVAGHPTVELYSGCFDGTVVAGTESVEPSSLTGLVQIGMHRHLPNMPADFRANFDPNGAMSFPAMARVGSGDSPSPTPAPGPSPSPQPTQPVQQTALCGGKQLVSSNIAGYTCWRSANDWNNPYGESLGGFTAEQCAASNGVWRGYDCDSAEEIMAAGSEYADWLRFVWDPLCCTTPEFFAAAGLESFSNSAGDLTHPGTIQNPFGNATAGSKVFKGTLVVSVDSPLILIGNETAPRSDAVTQALKAGIAAAISGVEASMVSIVSVEFPYRRLAAGSHRRLMGDVNTSFGDVNIEYMITAPQGSSLTADQIGAVGDQFTTHLNTQFQSAQIGITVATTTSSTPTEAIVHASTGTTTTEDPALVAACQTHVTSSALVAALMVATFAKTTF